MVLNLICLCTFRAVRHWIRLWYNRTVRKRLKKDACEVMQLTGWLPEDVTALVQSFLWLSRACLIAPQLVAHKKFARVALCGGSTQAVHAVLCARKIVGDVSGLVCMCGASSQRKAWTVQVPAVPMAPLGYVTGLCRSMKVCPDSPVRGLLCALESLPYEDGRYRISRQLGACVFSWPSLQCLWPDWEGVVLQGIPLQHRVIGTQRH